MEKSSIHFQTERAIKQLKKHLESISQSVLMIDYYKSKYFKEYISKKYPNADPDHLIQMSVSEIYPELESAIENFNIEALDIRQICYDPETNQIVKKD